MDRKSQKVAGGNGTTGNSNDFWKIVLLGGDQRQADYFIGEAGARGIEMDYFDSTLSMGFLGRFREYDAAIVHEDLKPLSGLELAEYLEKLFGSLPMILLRNETRSEDETFPTSTTADTGAFPLGRRETLPTSIVEHFSTEADVSQVVDRITLALSRPQASVLKSVK